MFDLTRMAYTLQALIADERLVHQVPALGGFVRLPQGKAMIPLSDQMREVHDIPFLPLTDEGASVIPEGIKAIAEDMAKAGRVVYVEAEFFGGDGTQACVTWDGPDQVSEPLVDGTAINRALRFLGVNVGDHHDEFDALGLGRHRATEDWLVEQAQRAASAPSVRASREFVSAPCAPPPPPRPSLSLVVDMKVIRDRKLRLRLAMLTSSLISVAMTWGLALFGALTHPFRARQILDACNPAWDFTSGALAVVGLVLSIVSLLRRDWTGFIGLVCSAETLTGGWLSHIPVI